MTNANLRRTKIVATLGPASDSPERVAQLIVAGVDVFRLNFSHGSYDDHGERIRRIREAAQAADRNVAILQDLQGPKIRTGTLKGGMPVLLTEGAAFSIVTTPLEGDERQVSTTYTALPDDVRPGESILLSDGLIELRVTGVRPGEVQTRVVYGGSLREKQGINLPGTAVSAPAITAKDQADLQWGLAHDVDYVAMSFVRRASDVQDLKQLIATAGKRTPVVAKIEKPQALQEIDAIMEATDVIMIARGDLGVEMAPEQVPLVQKDLIAAAARHNVTVITATQMLESMIQHARPTRAEASDVANAIFDGTDAVMLSGETANGQFPVEAVEMMARIACTTEQCGRYEQQLVAWWSQHRVHEHPDSLLAISQAARAIADTLPLAAVVAFTQSGRSARLVSANRPHVPIIAITPSADIARRVALYWGVQACVSPEFEHLNEVDSFIRRELPALGYAQSGDYVVLTGGHPVAEHGPTNFIKVLQI
ncbi:MAG: pyruvate kinase [Herpetosiphonaceae bacterium]|nr:pyruvate kinase [Herpetosiphonaceae bacterium]